MAITSRVSRINPTGTYLSCIAWQCYLFSHRIFPPWTFCPPCVHWHGSHATACKMQSACWGVWLWPIFRLSLFKFHSLSLAISITLPYHPKCLSHFITQCFEVCREWVSPCFAAPHRSQWGCEASAPKRRYTIQNPNNDTHFNPSSSVRATRFIRQHAPRKNDTRKICKLNFFFSVIHFIILISWVMQISCFCRKRW